MTLRTVMVAWILFALLLVGLSATAYTQAEDAIVVAELTAADHEADEGYFALGQKATLIAQPGSRLHGWLTNHRGQRVRVLITVADTDSH